MKNLESIQFNEEEIKVGQRICRSSGSDSYVYEVTKLLSATTFEMVKLIPISDPNWKPEIIPGGFVGHCVNQHEQKWTYKKGNVVHVVNRRTARCRGNTYHRIWFKGQSSPNYVGARTLQLGGEYFRDYNF
jgi:hypothetical protein